MIGTYTATESTSAPMIRDLYRKVGNKLELVPINRDEDGYGAPDPKRYKLILTGISDEFEEEGQWGLKTKVVCEFMVVGSKKWEGTRFNSKYTIPKSWTDDRARLGLLAAALLGKGKLEKDDQIDFGSCILNETVFEGVVEVETSDKGYQYPKIATHLALDTDDDDAPVAPRQRQLAADDEFPES